MNFVYKIIKAAKRKIKIFKYYTRRLGYRCHENTCDSYKTL